MAHSIEVFKVSATSCPETSSRNVSPLQVELTKFPLLSKDDGSKLRRPVRPIDRQRMRPWLMELLDLGNVFGLRWTNRHQGIFQISWRHASRLGWNLETDGDVFERWAKHTGIYKEGDPPEPKRWKANFRCALHSLHDVIELTNAMDRRGRNACRTYQFLQSSDDRSANRKRVKNKRTKEKYLKEAIPSVILDSCAHEEIVSHTECEAFPQDKVIVQKVDMKPDILVEDFCLQHDHDYAGPDKMHKTIVLRHGVGSIVLQKEVHCAPRETDEVEGLLISNLDQLASAAMSSAGVKSVQSQELDDVSDSDKESVTVRSIVGITDVLLSGDSNAKQPNLVLKYSSEEASALDGRAVFNNFTRKRKSVPVVDESFIVRVPPNEPEADNVDTNRSLRFCLQEGSSPSSCTRLRTGSPKILCRKSKRIKVETEENMTSPSEPLMSSCLLLLEAATRLDNAEKTFTSLSSKLQKGKHNFKTCSELQHHDCSTIRGCIQSDGKAKLDISTREFPKSFELICEKQSKLNRTEPSRFMSSFEVLRTTLESADSIAEHGNKAPSFTAKDIFEEPDKMAQTTDQLSEAQTVRDAPFATGLFSGSKIEPASTCSFICNKQSQNKDSMLLPESKPSLQKQRNNDCKSESVSGKDLSGALSSVTCNMAPVKSGKAVKQTLIQEAFPVIDIPQTKTICSELDLSTNSITIGDFDGQCPKICFSTESTPQTFTEVKIESDQSKGEFPCPRIQECPLLSSYNEQKCNFGTDETTVISILDEHDACIDGSSETKKCIMPSSFIALAPPTVKKVALTCTSCQSAPSEVLPIYSQAEVSAESSDLHLSESQNVVSLVTNNVISSDYIMENCAIDSIESALLFMQNKDVFIIEPGKNAVKDITIQTLPELANSSLIHGKLLAELKNTGTTEAQDDRNPERLKGLGIMEVSNGMWHGQADRDKASVLRPALEVSSVVNEHTLSVSDIRLSSIAHCDICQGIRSVGNENVLYEPIPASDEKPSQHVPVACSCSCNTLEIKSGTFSDVTTNDTNL